MRAEATTGTHQRQTPQQFRLTAGVAHPLSGPLPVRPCSCSQSYTTQNPRPRHNLLGDFVVPYRKIAASRLCVERRAPGDEFIILARISGGLERSDMNEKIIGASPACAASRLPQEHEQLCGSRITSGLERSDMNGRLNLSSEPGLRGEMLASGAESLRWVLQS